jgi:hypothetical protein
MTSPLTCRRSPGWNLAHRPPSVVEAEASFKPSRSNVTNLSTTGTGEVGLAARTLTPSSSRLPFAKGDCPWFERRRVGRAIGITKH